MGTESVRAKTSGNAKLRQRKSNADVLMWSIANQVVVLKVPRLVVPTVFQTMAGASWRTFMTRESPHLIALMTSHSANATEDFGRRKLVTPTRSPWTRSTPLTTQMQIFLEMNHLRHHHHLSLKNEE